MPLHGRFPRLFIGLVVSSSALAACTGGVAPATGSSGATDAVSQESPADQGAGAVTLPDPCSLLTPDEIKAQFTFDVKPGVGSSAPDSGAASPNCNWSPIEFHPEFGGVQLWAQKLDQGFFDFTKGPDSTDVAGLGDAAYFHQPTNPFTLEMKQGNLHLTLYVVAGSNEPPETPRQKVINLANDVLAHL